MNIRAVQNDVDAQLDGSTDLLKRSRVDAARPVQPMGETVKDAHRGSLVELCHEQCFECRLDREEERLQSRIIQIPEIHTAGVQFLHEAPAIISVSTKDLEAGKQPLRMNDIVTGEIVRPHEIEVEHAAAGPGLPANLIDDLSTVTRLLDRGDDGGQLGPRKRFIGEWDLLSSVHLEPEIPF